MSYCCEFTGKAAQNGNRVSHSGRRTKHLFLPNLHKVGFFSEILGKKFSFKVAASVIRSVSFCGGLDNFLIKQKDDRLSIKALKLKRLLLNHNTDTSSN